MIHELIDPKRKTVKTIPARHTKIVKDIKPPPFTESNHIDQSDNDNKDIDLTSTTFFPPWLRNSLGLTQRNNQNLDWSVCLPNLNALDHIISDQKPVRTIPRFKEQNHELDSVKTSEPQECCKRVSGNFENCIKGICVSEVTENQSQDVTNASPVNDDKKTHSLFWNGTLKESETESNAEIKIPKKNDSKTANPDLRTAELKKVKEVAEEEEKKQHKLIKQKNKMRKRIIGEHNKNEVDLLLEMKAREVLDNYTKKDVHSVTSEMKQLEAKLILLSAKCHDVDSKLTQQEIRLLQEIKNQAGSEETFNKVIEHLKEMNLREILRNSQHETPRGGGDKAGNDQKSEKPTTPTIQTIKSLEDGNKPITDKDSVISTDDENDIKRFSEFLSKNKNIDEKRKCLEEVRNYFERKRRTRLTKRRYLDESKIQKNNIPIEKKDEVIKEKSKVKELLPLSPRERKTKFGLIEEEIVEKAVDETLQKFIELYHFHVTPKVMNNMRRNILEAIQSDSLESKPSVKSLSERQDVPKDLSSQISALKDIKPKNQRKNFTDGEVQVIKDSTEVTQKELPVEVIMGPKAEAKQPKDVSQNEDVKRLKKEFEIFLNSLQTHTVVSDLKIQSVILEKEEVQSSKMLQFVYNFAKKALRPAKIDVETSVQSEIQIDAGTQTLKTEVSKRSLKSQTVESSTCEASIQTEEKTYVTVDAQTEELSVKELKELSFTDVSPGLYRMVKSKEPGRFYLYPENTENNEISSSEFNISELEAKIEASDLLSPFLEKSPAKQSLLGDKTKSKSQQNGKNIVSALNAPVEDNLQDASGSLNCLYYRPLVTLQQSEGTSLEEKTKNTQTTMTDIQDRHSGCVWFWNGEKINPGCDLKTHVENLVMEKLKELSMIQKRVDEENPEEKVMEVRRQETEDDLIAQAQAFCLSKSDDCNIDEKETNTTNTVFCFRAETDIQKEVLPFLISVQNATLEEKNKSEEEKENQDNVESEKTEASTKEEKAVKEVGTQNSQQTFLSLNLTKIRPRSRTVTRIKNGRKSNILLRQPSDTQENIISFRKTTDALKFLQELRKMKCDKQGIGYEVTCDSSSTVEDSLSSSTPMTRSENPLALLFEFHKKAEDEEKGDSKDLDIKNKIEKIISIMNNENQQNEDEVVETCTEKSSHWELIETLLNKVNQKERETLWNDIRDFVKTKIGKDINDEGAKEVCIEIEQDLPEDDEEEVKQAVFARGHFSKNEGDVEVEIDLTLEDLERILRHRQRKIRKRQLGRNRKSKKLIPASSFHSELPKDDLRKYLQVFTALGRGVASEKDDKTPKKN